MAPTPALDDALVRFALSKSKDLVHNSKCLYARTDLSKAEKRKQLDEMAMKVLAQMTVPVTLNRTSPMKPLNKDQMSDTYMSDYGYRGTRPYVKCMTCKRRYQVMANGKFHRSHNNQCKHPRPESTPCKVPKT